jgi:hypothetical protein
VVDFLDAGAAWTSVAAGAVVVTVLVAALAGAVMLQSAAPLTRREAAVNLFTVVSAPLFVTFIAIVWERFSELS